MYFRKKPMRSIAHIAALFTLCAQAHAITPTQALKTVTFCATSCAAVAAAAKSVYHYARLTHYQLLLQKMVETFNQRTGHDKPYLPSQHNPTYPPALVLEQPYVSLFTADDHAAAQQFPHEIPFYRSYVERNVDHHDPEFVGYMYLAVLCAIASRLSR